MFTLSPFLCYVTTKAARETSRLAEGTAAANELVAFQCGGDLEIRANLVRIAIKAICTQYFAHTTQADRMGTLESEHDYVLDRAAKIGFPLRGKQNAGGTDVLREASERHAFGARTGDGERKFELKTPCSSLFHGIGV